MAHHLQRRPVTNERRHCRHCRTLVTDAPPAGWVLHLLCREHSAGLVQTWGQASPRTSHLAQLSHTPGLRGSGGASPEDVGAAEEWPRRGLAMGLVPQEFEALQILLRRAFDAVGRTVWRRTFTSTERRLFAQSLPDLATLDVSLARAAPTEPPPPEPEIGEEKTLSFGSFAALVRGKMTTSACTDEMLVRMWLLLDVAPPRGQISWTELTDAVRQCPLYKADPAQPRIPHSDALPMPPWAPGQRVYVPQCGIGTVTGLGRMAGDVRVAIDAADVASQKMVWRRRQDLARITTDPNRSVQGLASPAAQALRTFLRQSQGDSIELREPKRAETKSLPAHEVGRPGASLWASSPLNMGVPSHSNRRHRAALARNGSKGAPRRVDRVRERSVKHRVSSEAAEQLAREQDAAAVKLYRASRLYGLIGDIDADEGCSPRTWWINERQRRAAAQSKAAADRLKKAEAAAAAALAEEGGDELYSFKSPYASTTARTASRGRPKRLRGGGRVLLPPSRAKSPPIPEPQLSHLIPKGPLLWDPVRGFDDSEVLQYPFVEK